MADLNMHSTQYSVRGLILLVVLLMMVLEESEVTKSPLIEIRLPS